MGYERLFSGDTNLGVSRDAADGDRDGVTDQIDPSLFDHMEFYLLNYFKPGVSEATPRTGVGLKLLNNG